MDKKEHVPNQPSMEGLKAELEHANRVLQTALKEVRESRLEMEKQDSRIHQLNTIVAQQREECLEWMHSAMAHKILVGNLQKFTGSQPLYARSLAEAVLQSSTEDPRFRSTNLLALALEEICKDSK